ncbi:MAG TPA: hypothetical protein VHI31_00780, partial [Actinomycetota bacterium]|nr:hypothetical protein [Actinomycetota bacterium]
VRPRRRFPAGDRRERRERPSASAPGGSSTPRWRRLRVDRSAAASIEELRSLLAPRPMVVLDAPADLRQEIDVWGGQPEPLLALMRRVKERFDPAGVCNRGIFVGGI